MRQARHTEEFEQVLLSYVEMCYSVAFALTRNPDRARDLARHVLTCAWQMRDRPDSKKDLKKQLLQALRERFLHHYCHVPRSLENLAKPGKDTACIAQDAEWNIEKVSRSVRTAM